MSTFLQMRTHVDDEAGMTLDADMVKRWVNDAYFEVQAAAKFPWRIRTKSVNTTASQPYVLLGDEVDDVISVLWAGSPPLQQWHPDAFADLFEGDTTETATGPTDCSVLRTDTTDTDDPALFIWPLTDGVEALAIRYVTRVAEMSADGDIPDMPISWHWLIIDGALAKLRRWEDDPSAEPSKQEFMLKLQAMVKSHGGDFVHNSS